MLNDILPLIHIAARNDYFKIIDHLADGQSPRNNDDARDSYAARDSACCVLRHGASIMSDDNARLLCGPSQQIRVR